MMNFLVMCLYFHITFSPLGPNNFPSLISSLPVRNQIYV